MKLTRSYSSDHVVAGNGTVSFACSTDVDEWPWLALGPRHPVVVQAQNFWTSIGASYALGSLSEEQWSALTWTEWAVGDPAAGLATRGTYGREERGDTDNFVISLFDDREREVVTMRGRGVIFRNRNFEEWRQGSKREAAEVAHEPIAFVSRDTLGIGASEHPLVGLPQGDTVPALVSRENGLPPANPMLGGSGDHVNSVHMIEAARQALCVLDGESSRTFTGGEMQLNRYVELGTQFRLTPNQRGANNVTFTLEQLERPCAELRLRW